MLAINEVLQNRYRIARQLGQGGMGAIYVAEDTKRFGKLVALKEILIDLSKLRDQKQQDLFRRAFEREAKILTQLEHEAFPQVVDYFLETDRQFLVMELVHGDDLSELLDKNQKAFPLADVVKWTDQLLDALDYLHTLAPPIIHRDIKPQNLKLTARGKIKLLDFGIATGSNAQLHATITTHTMVAATLYYSPLEQLIKAVDANYREFLEEKFGGKVLELINSKSDASSDIYALGATLYHLLTNKLPVDALKRALEIRAGRADPLQTPREANGQIPPEISEWLLRAMAIERENRFVSALEMQEALHEALSGKKRREEEENRQARLREQEELRREREFIAQERRNIEAERLSHQKRIEEERERQAERERERQSEAETEREIARQNSIIIEPLVNKSKDKPLAETKPSVTQPSVTQPPPENFARADSEAETPVIEESKNAGSSPEITDFSYLPDDFHQAEAEKQTPESKIIEEEKSFVSPVPPAESKKKAAWVLPVAAVALLLFGGAGLAAIFMLGNSADTNSNKPAANSAIVAPTPDYVSGNSNQTNANTPPNANPTPAPTRDVTVKTDEKPKPTIAPTVNKTPIQTVPKTPQKTPKPKPPQNSDCIFTGDC